MNQIYRFDCESPPDLNEMTLIDELARRKTLRQVVLLALFGILLNICLIIAAFVLYPINTFFSTACVLYVVATMCGSIAIATVFATNKKEVLTWHHS